MELVVGAAFGGVQRDFVPPADRPVESCLFLSLLASEPGGPRVFGIVLNPRKFTPDPEPAMPWRLQLRHSQVIWRRSGNSKETT